MANLLRSSKSGSDWTRRQGHLEFFGVQALPPPTVNAELLNVSEAQQMTDRNADLINLLDLALIRDGEDSAVDDVAVELFKAMGYVNRHRTARTRKDLILFICGEFRHAKTDVCILNRVQDAIILLVQEDKRLDEVEKVDARAQLVAEAIAAFRRNNIIRENNGLEPLPEQIIPGITMVATTPTFFKIPVTAELVVHVGQGTYPLQTTLVTYCLPPLARRYSEGMKPLDNRQTILSCYEAFKTIVGI
ncbi:hypothetical protein GYMLUDRAFT_55680 [Collybiopsis luxurians FD-317 M1]|nr:hypothetical protein GYMLUDRAFT_55680 [Collybiopsis luxurians FD-317 M1]